MTTKPVDGPVEDMSFDLAFDEAAAGVPPAVDEPAPAPGADPEPVPVVPPVAAADPEPVPPVDPAAEWKAKNAELERQLAEAKKVATPPPAPAPAPEVNKEEVEALAEFKKDWPNVQAATEIMIKQSMATLTSTLKTEIETQIKALQGVVAPAIQAAADTQVATFRTEILKLHPDAMTIYPQVDAWVAKQTPRLKESYSAILDNGTVTEFAELLTMYKAATGVKTVVPDPAPPKDDGKEDRLQRMEGVRRARTGASAEIDENDFDGAFEAASRAK